MSILPLNQGGTGSDLSGTGGAGQVVKQTSAGADLSVANIAISDLPTSGTWPFGGTVSGNPTISGNLTASGQNTLQAYNLNNIVLVDGNKYTTIQLAINALGANGGAVLIPASATPYAGFSSVPDNVSLIGMGSGLGYGISGNRVLVQWSSTLTLTNMSNCRFENIFFDFLTLATSSPAGLVLASDNGYCVQNSFRNCIIQGGGSGVPVLSLTAAGSPGNNTYNSFEHVIVACNPNSTGSNPGPAVGLYLSGSGGSGGAAVTQNEFSDIFIRGGVLGGIDIETNCDTNFFSKISVFQEWKVDNVPTTPSNSYGLAFNLSDSGSDIDAGGCYFYNFNTTPGPGVSGGFSYTIKAGQSTGNVIDITGYGSTLPTAPFTVDVVGGTPQFCGRVINLNNYPSYNYTWCGSSFIVGSQTSAATGTASGTPYSTTMETATNIDGTHLRATIFVPIGFKLIATFTGCASCAESAQGCISLYDSASSTTIASNILSTNSTFSPFSMQGLVTGNNGSHTITAQYFTNESTNAISVVNSTYSTPTILFQLVPSN
jgi:hypothetical protein